MAQIQTIPNEVKMENNKSEKAETQKAETQAEGPKTLEELNEEWAVEADERLQRLNGENQDLRSSKSKVLRELETLTQKLFDIHTDNDKALHRGNWDNDFDHGTCQGWLEAMEMVIFNLEKIKRGQNDK
tara:strand:- start:42 stop:428 length:387 start_codon:yes stop_codon:yes gene_type:complete